MEQQALAVKRLSREEAQQLVRSSRLDPIFSQSLVNELHALAEQPEQAISINLPPETRYTTMKARLKRIAKRMQLQITIRKTAEGLVCWQETAAEEKQRLSRSYTPHTGTSDRNDVHRSYTADTA
jgi:hypothetical protein